MSILDVRDLSIIDYYTGLTCTGRDAAHILAKAVSKHSASGVMIYKDNKLQFISMAFEMACGNLGY